MMVRQRATKKPGRRRWVRAIGVALAIAAVPSRPAQAAPSTVPVFDATAFERARSAGRTVVVDSYASWCLPCRIQAPILARLKREKRFAEIVIMRVGADTPEAVWRKFDLAGYGMMLVFKQGREVARGMPTNEASMRKLLTATP